METRAHARPALAAGSGKDQSEEEQDEEPLSLELQESLLQQPEAPAPEKSPPLCDTMAGALSAGAE